MTNRKEKTRFLTQLALLIAIELVMAYTPLGYIKTPALSITLMTVPVAVAAVLLGPAGGAIAGLVFGITSFVQCFGAEAFGTTLLSISFIGTFCTAVLARVLEGYVGGLLFNLLYKTKLNNGAIYVASFATPLLNTLFFMSSLVIFFYNSEFIQGFVDLLGAANPFAFVLGFVGTQGLIEALACGTIASVLNRALFNVVKK